MKAHEEGGSGWIIPVLMLLAVAVIILSIWRKNVRKKRDDY